MIYKLLWGYGIAPFFRLRILSPVSSTILNFYALRREGVGETKIWVKIFHSYSLKLQRSGFQISHSHRMKGLPGRAYQDIKSHFSSPTNTDIFELKHSFIHSNSYRHDPCHIGLPIQNIGKILQSGVCPASCAFQQMHVIFILRLSSLSSFIKGCLTLVVGFEISVPLEFPWIHFDLPQNFSIFDPLH